MLNASFKFLLGPDGGICAYTRCQTASTSNVCNDMLYLCISGYQSTHKTSRRTGDNETKANPTIHTYLLIALTGDYLQQNASLEAMRNACKGDKVQTCKG